MSDQIAIIGLGTMGANLARNAARNGATVAVYNRTQSVTNEFIQEYGDEGNFVACTSYADIAEALDRPRAALILLKAG